MVRRTISASESFNHWAAILLTTLGPQSHPIIRRSTRFKNSCHTISTLSELSFYKKPEINMTNDCRHVLQTLITHSSYHLQIHLYALMILYSKTLFGTTNPGKESLVPKIKIHELWARKPNLQMLHVAFWKNRNFPKWKWGILFPFEVFFDKTHKEPLWRWAVYSACPPKGYLHIL